MIDSILKGLEKAIAFAEGNETEARVHRSEVRHRVRFCDEPSDNA